MAEKNPEDEQLEGQVFTNNSRRFAVGKFLAGGSYGRVYLGKHIDSGREVVIKMEKQSLETPQLHLEFGFYRELNSNPYRGIPNIYAFGALASWNYLVMDPLGPSLETMLERCAGTFSLITVIKLSIQLINLIEAFHSRGILYRDTKPQNFLLGLPNTSRWHVIHIIDLGFCKKWRNPDGTHIDFQEGKPVTGTARYISINNHLGYEQGRRDDLEAIGYMLVYFFFGSLPWQGLQGTIAEKTFQMGEAKRNIPVSEIFGSMPEEFHSYMSTVKSLKFEEEPQYRKLDKMFNRLLSKLGLDMEDKVYDWSRTHQTKHLLRKNLCVKHYSFNEPIESGKDVTNE